MIWNDRIRDLRKWHKLTLKEVASKLHTTEATAQRYETTIKNIPYDVIENYAKIFDVTPSYIMGWDSDHDGGDVLAEVAKTLPKDEYRRLLAYAIFLSKYNLENPSNELDIAEESYEKIYDEFKQEGIKRKARKPKT